MIVERQEDSLTFSRQETSKGEKMEMLLTSVYVFSPMGEWADPGGTAIPGQPVAKVEQAPDTSPMFKNQFNIEAPG